MKQRIKRLIILAAIIVLAGTALLLLKDFIILPAAKPLQKHTPTIEYGIVTDSFSILREAIEPGQNLSILFSSFRVPDYQINLLNEKTRGFIDLRKVKAGNGYTAMFTNDNQRKLQYFVYELSDTNYVIFDFRDSLHVHHGSHEVTRRLRSASGKISSSLWSTLENSGTDPYLAVAMAQIYQWTIDFYAIRKDDEFKVIYEDISVGGKSVGLGSIHAAWFNHAGKEYYAYRFQQEGREEYFNEKGENLRREFLKAPLKFTRVSSKFSHSRLHPVLRIRRPHHGVDYAAPTGTPVHSIGNGTVVKAAYSGGAGRMVTIKHNSNYTTSYLHLSGFGKGVRNGARVTQGQVIGYVGSSGLSTGPHLDFRIYRNSQPIDPLKVESPPAYPVADKLKSQYDSITGVYKKNLSLIK